MQESLEAGIATDEHVGRFVVSRQLSGRASIDAGYVGRRFINGDNAETSHGRARRRDVRAGALHDAHGAGRTALFVGESEWSLKSSPRWAPRAEHHPVRPRLLAR